MLIVPHNFSKHKITRVKRDRDSCETNAKVISPFLMFSASIYLIDAFSETEKRHFVLPRATCWWSPAASPPYPCFSSPQRRTGTSPTPTSWPSGSGRQNTKGSKQYSQQWMILNLFVFPSQSLCSWWAVCAWYPGLDCDVIVWLRVKLLGHITGRIKKLKMKCFFKNVIILVVNLSC